MLSVKKKAVSRQLSLFSPAKINVFFRVLRKREDGFHEIASLYQAISLGDVLNIAISDCDSLSCTDASLLGDSNLINKALNVFRKKNRQCPFFSHPPG